MSKHTPGPWEASGPRGSGFYTNYGISHQSPGHSGGELAEVTALHSTPEALATLKANAKLIAAAPEMLEALEGWINVFKVDGGMVPAGLIPLLKQTSNAIQKAKGE